MSREVLALRPHSSTFLVPCSLPTEVPVHPHSSMHVSHLYQLSLNRLWSFLHNIQALVRPENTVLFLPNFRQIVRRPLNRLPNHKLPCEVVDNSNTLRVWFCIFTNDSLCSFLEPSRFVPALDVEYGVALKVLRLQLNMDNAAFGRSKDTGFS
jgi:hypothetical protein